MLADGIKRRGYRGEGEGEGGQVLQCPVGYAVGTLHTCDVEMLPERENEGPCVCFWSGEEQRKDYKTFSDMYMRTYRKKKYKIAMDSGIRNIRTHVATHLRPALI